MEILSCETSRLGLLVLRRRRLLGDPDTVITEVTLDHEMLMSSYITASERALARFGLEFHPGKTLNVLVGGLGLGYTAHELLKSDRAAMVEVVEFLPQVIDWLTGGLVPLANELNSDPRLCVTEGDVFARLSAKPGETHDLIVIDVDHSPDERLGDSDGSFYSMEGLAKAKRHLSPEGILGIWSYAKNDGFHKNLCEVFSRVRVETVTFENHLIERQETNWLFFAR